MRVKNGAGPRVTTVLRSTVPELLHETGWSTLGRPYATIAMNTWGGIDLLGIPDPQKTEGPGS